MITFARDDCDDDNQKDYEIAIIICNRFWTNYDHHICSAKLVSSLLFTTFIHYFLSKYCLIRRAVLSGASACTQ